MASSSPTMPAARPLLEAAGVTAALDDGYVALDRRTAAARSSRGAAGCASGTAPSSPPLSRSRWSLPDPNRRPALRLSPMRSTVCPRTGLSGRAKRAGRRPPSRCCGPPRCHDRTYSPARRAAVPHAGLRRCPPRRGRRHGVRRNASTVRRSAEILALTAWDHPSNVERRDYLQIERDAWAAATGIGDTPSP